MRIGPSEILQLGHPRLREPSAPVADVRERAFVRERDRLVATLAAFRERFGFGRAIAAPQIGVGLRLIAVDLGAGPFVVVNPTIVAASEETFTMWDDCMSFPSLMTRLRRHAAIEIDSLDAEGAPVAWRGLDRATSELMQHEIDHLDGIVAVDRAEGLSDIVSRETFEAMRPRFDAMVDYTIPPPPLPRP